nr:hypothetical protein [Marinicella sp. W31]MDC2879876.1 hypothetical protein [Marinicella sp. W31]
MFDIDNGRPVARTTATQSGSWSVVFEQNLPEGARVQIATAQADGRSEPGPIVNIAIGGCLMPAIIGIDKALIWGRAVPGYTVMVERYRNGLLQETYEPVKTASDTSWYLKLPAPPQSGDLFAARTAALVKRSKFYNALPFGEVRQAVPIIRKIDEKGANGLAEPGQFVIVSTRSAGELLAAACDESGAWRTPNRWSDYGVHDPARELFFFEVAETLDSGIIASTSDYVACYGSASASPPLLQS